MNILKNKLTLGIIFIIMLTLSLCTTIIFPINANAQHIFTAPGMYGYGGEMNLSRMFNDDYYLYGSKDWASFKGVEDVYQFVYTGPGDKEFSFKVAKNISSYVGYGYANNRMHVANVQKVLNDVMRIRLVEDGYFGPKTYEAIKMFQRKYGLTPDGIVGLNTYRKMNEVLP